MKDKTFTPAQLSALAEYLHHACEWALAEGYTLRPCLDDDGDDCCCPLGAVELMNAGIDRAARRVEGWGVGVNSYSCRLPGVNRAHILDFVSGFDLGEDTRPDASPPSDFELLGHHFHERYVAA